MKTYTRGNVIVEDIKIGDIHYEYDYGMCIKPEVIALPMKDEDENWVWQSKHLKTGDTINYMVNPMYSHYSMKLYDYEAYDGCKMV